MYKLQSINAECIKIVVQIAKCTIPDFVRNIYRYITLNVKFELYFCIIKFYN